jgi:hypothetical protein
LFRSNFAFAILVALRADHCGISVLEPSSRFELETSFLPRTRSTD